MSQEGATLVVGADGMLGAAILSRLELAGDPVIGTSRRAPSGDGDLLRFDLSQDTRLPAIGAGCALICAGITRIEACETDPRATRRINVERTLQVARELLDEGAHVVFLSSNAVFDGAHPFAPEDEAPNPTTEYGRQKAEVEMELTRHRHAGRVALVRLTKVLAPTAPLFRRFIHELATGNRIEAFSDLFLSPISLEYTTAALVEIARSRAAGIFHLSADAELSYAELAQALALRIGAPAERVLPVSCAERGAVPLFRPRHPALGMARTRETLGIAPQSVSEAAASLLGTAGASHTLARGAPR